MTLLSTRQPFEVGHHPHQQLRKRNDKDLPKATWLVNGRAPRQKPTPDWVPRSVSPLFTGLPGLPWDAGSS